MVLKDFGPIESDYVFFMSHSTEAENALASYLRELAQFNVDQETIRMLDFGCGTGVFTERLLSSMTWRRHSLELTLVEPVRHQREQAVLRLARFSNGAIVDAKSLFGIEDSVFDLIVSNHVLYYVEDLHETLRQLNDSLSPKGLMLLALAAWDNFLLQLWRVGFSKLKQPVPYSSAEDVEAGLLQLGLKYEKKKVSYEICFLDSDENRKKILRFLFGHVLQEVGDGVLLSEFDGFVAGNQIRVSTHCFHLIVRQD